MGRMALIRGLMAVTSLTGALASSSQAFAQEAAEAPALDADELRVRALVRESAKTFAANDMPRTRQLLLEAWHLRQTYDVAAALGQAEAELGDYVAATRYVSFAVRHFVPGESEQALRDMKARLATLKCRVGTVRVSVEPEGAELHIDGARSPEAPFGPEVYVAAGMHLVEAEFAGARAKQYVHAAPGEDVTIHLVVSPRPPATQRRPRTPVAQEGRAGNGERPIAPVVVGGAVTLVSLGLGIGFQVVARARKSDLEQLFRSLPAGNACSPSSALASECAELHDRATRVDSARNASYAAFAVAGAAALGTTLYWVLSSPNRGLASGRALMVLPAIGSGMLGATAASSF